MNKQPFYHRAVILFTATREISRDELTKALRIVLEQGRNVVIKPSIASVRKSTRSRVTRRTFAKR